MTGAPQSANSYSYAVDNPITKKDPTGRCPVCVGALIGAAGFVGVQAYSDISNKQFSGFGAYGRQAMFGAADGAAAVILAPVSMITALGAAGTIAFGSSIVSQVDNPKNTDGQIKYSQVAVQSLVAVATAGVGKIAFPAISGRLPSNETFINAVKNADLAKVTEYFTSTRAKVQWTGQLLSGGASAAADVNKPSQSQSTQSSSQTNSKQK